MPACLTADDFDFDAWKELARRHPEDFEEFRLAAIDRFISASSGEERLMLMRLQFRIDAERIRSRTPLKACLRISGMMWDSLFKMHSRLDAFSSSPHTIIVAPSPAPREAAIIPFPSLRKIC